MNAVKPPIVHENAVYVTFAKNQPEYTPLIAAVDPAGTSKSEPRGR